MSGSVIFVWDPVAHGPLPKSIGEALERSDTLLDLASPPSPAMLAFAERLNAYLNDNRDQFEDDADFIEAYEGFSAQVTVTERACLKLETPEHARERFLWAVVTEAQAQGLVVTDDILGIAFLPDGKVYPPSKAKLWKGLNDYFMLELDGGFPTTLAGFRKVVVPQMEAVLLAKGFQLKEEKEHFYGYERKYGEIIHRFGFECQLSNNGFILACSISVFHALVEEICVKSGFEFLSGVRIFSWAYSTYNMGLPQTAMSDRINSYEDLASTLRSIEDYALKALDYSCNIKGLNEVMNGDLMPHISRSCHRSFYMPVALIVARLSGSDKFEALCESLLVTGVHWRVKTSSSKGYQEAWATLVKTLREEVQPLPEAGG